jgi:hypothetical protein
MPHPGLKVAEDASGNVNGIFFRTLYYNTLWETWVFRYKWNILGTRERISSESVGKRKFGAKEDWRKRGQGQRSFCLLSGLRETVPKRKNPRGSIALPGIAFKKGKTIGNFKKMQRPEK